MLKKLAPVVLLASLSTPVAADLFEPNVYVGDILAVTESMNQLCVSFERTSDGITRPVGEICMSLFPDVPTVVPSADATYSMRIRGCLDRTGEKGGYWCSPDYRVINLQAVED